MLLALHEILVRQRRSRLVLPFPNRAASVPMIWQAEAGLWFRMPGGY